MNQQNQQQNSKYEQAISDINQAINLEPMQAIQELSAIAQRGVPLASEKAVLQLSRFSHPQVANTLCQLYWFVSKNPQKLDRSCSLRIAIVNAMGDTGLPSVCEAVHHAARTVEIARLGPVPEDVGIGLRAAAAIALAKADSDCLYELCVLFSDAEAVRSAAARALGVVGNPAAASILAARLKLSSSGAKLETNDVLGECIEALVPLRPRFLLEVVAPYFNHQDSYLASIAALSIAEHMGESALPILQDALQTVSSTAKETIVIAIASVRSRNTRDILLALLDSTDSNIRLGAVQGIKPYVDDEIRKKLKQIAQADSLEEIRRAAQV